MVGRKPLTFSKEYKDKILSGKKRSTVRLRTNLKVGDIVELHVGGEKIGVAEITDVSRKKLSQLTDSDARRDGFKNRRELLKALRKHYGKQISKEAEVHIIGFKLKRRTTINY